MLMELVGWSGSIAIIAAYTVKSERASTCLNFFGSVALMVYAIEKEVYPQLATAAAWFVITCKHSLASAPPEPEPPVSSESHEL